MVFFLFQRSFTALTHSLAHGDAGEGGCAGGGTGSCGPPALGGSGGSGQQGHCALLAPHCQGRHFRSFGWFAEGCRDAPSSRGAAGAPSSWLGSGGCCTPTLELSWTEPRHQCRAQRQRQKQLGILSSSCRISALVCRGSHQACLGCTGVEQGCWLLGRDVRHSSLSLGARQDLALTAFLSKEGKTEHCILGVLFGRRIPRIVILF